jgi:phosphoribosylanthranilate isomerase
MCVDAGVDWIGLNLWSGSPRRCDWNVALRIRQELAADVRLVGVFVDAPNGEIDRFREHTGIEWAQLHGSESPAALDRVQPHAFKALRVRSPLVTQEARTFGGPFLLLDAYTKDRPGGTGIAFEWDLARPVATERNVILAGGLTPSNVGRAIQVVRPFGVDVASGVEQSPGVKDESLVRAFVRAVREPAVLEPPR